MTVETADVVVIGAGVIGCSVAHALAREGWTVVVVAREGGPGLGSTSASSAIIRFNYSTFAGVATAWESHFAWQDWEGYLGGRDDDGRLARFVRTGGFSLDCPTLDPSKVLRLFDEVGVPYETWDAATLRARVPGIDPARHWPPKPVDGEEFWADPDGELGAYFTPDAGFVDDPSFAAHNLATAGRRLGVRFRFRSTVTGILADGGRVSGAVLDGGDRVCAPVVVNVAGPASGRVNEMAGVRTDFAVGTRPLRTESHHLPGPPGYADGGAPGPVGADLDLGTYYRGTPSGEMLVGGTEPECDPMEWLDDPDDYAPGPSQEVYQAQAYRAARRFPDLTVPNRPKGIGAVYDVSDDWIPIYDRTALPGFYVAIGTSGNQFKNSPMVGRYLHAIIDACENGRDHDAEPVAVTLPVCGHVVDLSAYSRRRTVNADSSFTVMG